MYPKWLDIALFGYYLFVIESGWQALFDASGTSLIGSF